MSSCRIKVLPDVVINQIAAGEVIENPASVVKELVENSLDAEATEVLIEIQVGGRECVRITDNGYGMARDEALLSLERHATSKLSEINDFASLHTMGFRGEAVPSIASISKMVMITSQGEGGSCVIVEGGKIKKCSDATRDRGTTIEVKGLFYNVPVRRKFQRSPNYDRNEVLKVVTRLALGYPGVSFALIADGKRLLDVKQGTLEERIEAVLGPEFLSSTCPIECKGVTGRVGFPSFCRHNRSGQYLFINKRAVFSSLIADAVRDGYGTALPSQKYPIYVLHITLDGEAVDVNVHPQKREVRLREREDLREEIARTISQTVHGKRSSPPSVQAVNPPFIPAERLRLPEVEVIKTPVVREEPAAYVVSSRYHVFGQWNGYLFTEDKENGFFIVDQRRAHQRILYEKLLKKEQKAYEMQSLLIPIVLEFTPVEKKIFASYLESLKEIGIQATEFSPTSYSVDALPSFLNEEGIRKIVEELLLDGTVKQIKKDALCRKASQCSLCHKKQLSDAEAQSLVDQLFQCSEPYGCPFGKPTVVTLTHDEMDKRFMRK